MSELSQRLMKLFGNFIKCHKVCGNNCEVYFVTYLLVLHVTNSWKFQLNIKMFALVCRRGNKQAAKEKQYVSILYLSPGKYTIVNVTFVWNPVWNLSFTYYVVNTDANYKSFFQEPANFLLLWCHIWISNNINISKFRLLGVEDTGYITIEHRVTNLLFLLFSLFFCLLVSYCLTSAVSSTPSRSPNFPLLWCHMDIK